MDNQKILYRFYVAGFILLLLFFFCFFRLLNIHFFSKIDAIQTVQSVRTPAVKGEIYSSDGQLLVSSVTRYEIRFDPISVSKHDWEAGIEGLAKEMDDFLSKPKGYHYKKMTAAREKHNRFLLIAKNVGYLDYKKIEQFPIFEKGPYKGGLIGIPTVTREYPWGQLALRTLGYEELFNGQRKAVGIEGAYGRYLRGSDGFQLRQRIGKNQWKPIYSNEDIESSDGSNVYTTIDTYVQEVTHDALLSYLERYDAGGGVAVVMEVKTGKIRGISNLSRSHDGGYGEFYNHAIGTLYEPGSMFKLMSYCVLLEGGSVDLSTKIDTKHGVYKVHGYRVRDSRIGGYGVLSLKDAFAHSSNVAIAKLINMYYGDNPRKFLDRLSLMGVDKRLGISISGEPQPNIPYPDTPKWSKISLPWMSYGYGLAMTPLQVLSFYNAVANNGEYLRPQFVEKIVSSNGQEKVFSKQVINPMICSKSTIDKLKELLASVVKSGTASNIYMKEFPMSGKTGTAQKKYWRGQGTELEYNASFVGYFPSDQPKYSVIVLVSDPKKEIGYYGSAVAAPVFKEIAKKLYVTMKDTLTTDVTTLKRAIYDRYQKKAKRLEVDTPDLV